MPDNKKQIAVRVCGGCFCKYDVKKVLQQVQDAFSENCAFVFSYQTDQDSQYDAVLLINGCDYECAEKSTLVENININNTNWEQATLIFAEKIQPSGLH